MCFAGLTEEFSPPVLHLKYWCLRIQECRSKLHILCPEPDCRFWGHFSLQQAPPLYNVAVKRNSTCKYFAPFVVKTIRTETQTHPASPQNTCTQQSTQKHCASSLNMKFYLQWFGPQDFMLLFLYVMERIYGDSKQCSKIFALVCTKRVLEKSTTFSG